MKQNWYQITLVFPKGSDCAGWSNQRASCPRLAIIKALSGRTSRESAFDVVGVKVQQLNEEAVARTVAVIR